MAIYDTAAAVDDLAVRTDKWISANWINEVVGHAPFLAQLYNVSKEPGGGFEWMKGGCEGNNWRYTHVGQGLGTVEGITRAQQDDARTNAILSNYGGNSVWPWSMYTGSIPITEMQETLAKNGSETNKIDLMRLFTDTLRGDFMVKLNTDLFDYLTHAENKVMSVMFPLLNTGAPGGLDQTDAANAWFKAQQDTTASTITTTSINALRLACRKDTAHNAGVRKFLPDMGLIWDEGYTKIWGDLESSQRISVEKLLDGGAEYMNYSGLRLFQESALTDGDAAILNSSTWSWRTATEYPEPTTPGFVTNVNQKAMRVKLYKWIVSLGCISPSRNGIMRNKTAGQA